jgi:hypothetical protein
MTSTPEWQPPEKPDPRQILQESVDDRRHGRFAAALAKHLWFHRHALEYRPSLYGVRLSFAMSYWFELANQFAPARDALILLRDEAEEQILAGATDSASRFSEFESINHHFQQHSRTSELFEKLATDNPQLATRVYDRAQRALIVTEKYALCSQLLTNPEATFEYERELLRDCLSRNKGKECQREMNTASRTVFARNVGDLIAILARNNRHAEAQQIAALAGNEWKNPKFQTLLDHALRGEFPERPF